MWCVGAVLTQEEIEQLMGKLESVTTTLKEREKAKRKEKKVSSSPPLPNAILSLPFQLKESGNFPKLPDWLTERTYASKDFCELPLVPSDGGVTLGSLPLAMQQHAIVEDLLSLMNGLDGRSEFMLDAVKIDFCNHWSLQIYSRQAPLCPPHSTLV